MRERSRIVSFLKNLRAAIFPVIMLVMMASAAWGAPTVTAFTPPEGSNPLSTTTVSATFSEPMDPATITSGSFTVSKSVKIKAVAAGQFHTVVLKSDGTVAAWGMNNYDQSTVPQGLSGITAIAAGSWHSLALRNNGTVVSWGSPSTIWGIVPPGLSGVVAIAAGSIHSMALKNDGTVVAWGKNDYGQSSVPSGLSGVVAIAAGQSHSLALKSDGTVVAWGSNNAYYVTGYNGNSYNEGYAGQATVPTGLSGIIAISAGANHSLALRNDGTVVAWGLNNWGQSSIPSGLTGVAAISCGDYNSFVLKKDGTVAGWGFNTDIYAMPFGLSGVIAISARTGHGIALKNDGTVVAWGDNSYNQATVPRNLSGVVAVSDVYVRVLALKNDGTVVAWGDGQYGQIAVPQGLSGVTSVSAGGNHSLALKNDGTIVAWGSNGSGESTVPPGLSGVVAISAGANYSLALKNDGTVVAWGSNYYSVPPIGLSGVVAISTVGYHSLALKNDGTVVAWGQNYGGESSVPPGLSGVVAISAGINYSLALKSDGTVVAWGQGYAPSGVSGVVAISAGNRYSLALKNDGTIVGWGSNGLLIVPSDQSGIVFNSAKFFSLALKNDGTVVAWGTSMNGLKGNVPASPYETVVQGSVVYDQTTNTATFTPSVPLDPGVTYIGRVNTGVRNIAGEHLAADVSWRFTPVQAPATITLVGLNQVYDGMPKEVTTATDPSGLAVSVTYNGSATPPSAVGSYTVVATVNDAAYIGSSNATLTIANPTFTISSAVVGGNGSISCDSPVSNGGNSICTVAPATNYHLATFTDNNEDKLGSLSANSYTIVNVTADHVVLASFAVNLTANAGPNQTITCSGPTGAQVTLDGSASTGAASYTWDGPFGTATGVNPTITIPWGTHTITLTVNDGAGKTSAASVVITVTDNVPPLVNVVANGTSGNNDWFVSSINLGLNAADSCSGMREIRYTLDSNAEQVVSGAVAAFNVTGEGFHTVTYRAIDNANNEVSNSISFKIDNLAPVITGAVLTPPNANGWHNGNVSVHFSASDAISGIASLTPDSVVANEGAGQIVSGSAVDMAGNQSSYNVTGINVDKTPPVVTITGVTNGSIYKRKYVPTASYTATDGISGVATSSGILTGGDKHGRGQFTYTVTATDKAGNIATSSVIYKVKHSSDEDDGEEDGDEDHDHD